MQTRDLLEARQCRRVFFISWKREKRRVSCEERVNFFFSGKLLNDSNPSNDDALLLGSVVRGVDKSF